MKMLDVLVVFKEVFMLLSKSILSKTNKYTMLQYYTYIYITF